MTARRRHLGVLFGLSFLLYLNTLSHSYTQDDAIVITDNMYTTAGFSGIPGILTKDTFYGFFKEEGKAQLVAGGRYRPLSLVLFALEVELFGQRPWVGHLMNALFYGLTVVVLYLLLFRLFRLRYGEKVAYTVALVAGLLFATHPVHTEVVANIKGLDEILALLGSLGALYLSLRAYRRKRASLHWVAGGVFFLALLSKENAITFLAVAPLTFYIFTRADLRRILVQSLPFVLAALAFLFIRFSILGWSLGEPPMELMNNPHLKIVNGQWVPFTFSERLATVTYTLGKYLQLLVFPHPLTHDYYPRQIDLMSWSDLRVILSLLLYLGMGVYALLGLRRRKPLSYGILFYLITLSIVSNLFFPVGTHMSERLIFMPSVGFSIVIGVLVWRLLETRPQLLRPVLIGLGVIGLLFSIKTITRNQVWQDNYTLFLTDVQTSPNSAKLRNAAGGELLTQSLNVSDPDQQRTMRTEAVGHLQEAVRLHPTYKNAYLLLGNAYNYLQQYEPSIAAYQQALQLDGGYELAQQNLAVTYRDAGKYYGEQQGDLQQALRYLQQAYQMQPQDYETLRLLGVAHGMSGQQQQAIDYFTKAAEIEPQNADAWYNLGAAYFQSGQAEVGQVYIDRAKTLDPDIETKRQ